MALHRRSLLRAWLPVVLWLGVIAVESTGLMSSPHTGSILFGVLSAIFGPLNKHKFEIFHGILRKCGHFAGYGILSMLFFRALVKSSLGSMTVAMYRRLALYSVAFTFAVASLDEWHQTFLPSRTGTIRDVLLDTGAAVVLQYVVVLVLHRRGTPTVRAAGSC
jgi:VanZ family protein